MSCTCWPVLDNEHVQNLNVCLQDFIKERNAEEMSFEEFTENHKSMKKILRY